MSPAKYVRIKLKLFCLSLSSSPNAFMSRLSDSNLTGRQTKYCQCVAIPNHLHPDMFLPTRAALSKCDDGGGAANNPTPPRRLGLLSDKHLFTYVPYLFPFAPRLFPRSGSLVPASQ